MCFTVGMIAGRRIQATEAGEARVSRKPRHLPAKPKWNTGMLPRFDRSSSWRWFSTTARGGHSCWREATSWLNSSLFMVWGREVQKWVRAFLVEAERIRMRSVCFSTSDATSLGSAFLGCISLILSHRTLAFWIASDTPSNPIHLGYGPHMLHWSGLHSGWSSFRNSQKTFSNF